MLRLIAADAEIDGVAFFIILAPRLFAASFPAVGDRVADHQQIDIALLDSGVHVFMPFEPPWVLSRNRRDGRIGALGLLGRRDRRQNGDGQDQCRKISDTSNALHGRTPPGRAFKAGIVKISDDAPTCYWSKMPGKNQCPGGRIQGRSVLNLDCGSLLPLWLACFGCVRSTTGVTPSGTPKSGSKLPQSKDTLATANVAHGVQKSPGHE